MVISSGPRSRARTPVRRATIELHGLGVAIPRVMNGAADRQSPGSHTLAADGASCLWHESNLPLMSDRQHPHLVLRDDESVQRDVARLAEGNHELPNVAVHTPPEQRVRGQAFDRRADGPGRCDCRVRVLACQELEGALEVEQCPRRINYRGHGFGRAAS